MIKSWPMKPPRRRFKVGVHPRLDGAGPRADAVGEQFVTFTRLRQFHHHG